MKTTFDWPMFFLALFLGASIGSDLTFRFLNNDLHRARQALEEVSVKLEAIIIEKQIGQ